MLNRWSLLIVSGAAIVSCAFSSLPIRNTLLIGLMLALPLLDKTMHRLPLALDKTSIIRQTSLLAVAAFILILNPDYFLQFITLMIFVALPEEWFFRAWFMSAINRNLGSWWLANIITSCLFVAAHIPTHGLMSLTIFFPSLIFGYIYQRYRDLVLTIMVHVIFNLLYVLYLKPFLINL